MENTNDNGKLFANLALGLLAGALTSMVVFTFQSRRSRAGIIASFDEKLDDSRGPFADALGSDYRNGVRWWQFDPTKWLIKAGTWVGLTKDLNRVPNFKIRRATLIMKFKHAQQQVASASNAEHWQICLEHEYQQFVSSLNEWNQPRQQWYEQKRLQLCEATQELSQDLHIKWEQTALRTRFKELEYSLKMQAKRLDRLTLQFA